METAPLKSFATWARLELITQVSARLTAVLAPASAERVENQRAVAMLERDIAAAGGGAKGKDAIADKVAYTWFNRIIALRFMDANGYTGVGVVSPARGQQTGQPEILADAKRGSIDPAVVTDKRTLERITGLLDGSRLSADGQGEAYTLLLAEYCRYWNRAMPFMFEREGDYTEILIPANLLAADSVLSSASSTLTEEVCRDVEVIGWFYQFYISERKDEVFAGFKKGKKAGAAEIPAATQLFTPHWIVRYLVENSLGRLWMLNHPSSRLVKQMDYYIAPIDEETDFLKISSPEELTVMDPACGSGHMLTYAFDLLYAIYEEEGYAPSEIPELVLTHNLYGTEIDSRAGSLAAFALTMKARAKQRSFFKRQVKPNICVLEPISFSPDELDYLVTKDGDRHAEEAFWNQFAEADTFGSLIQPGPDLTTRLARQLDSLNDEGDMFRADALRWAQRAIYQAEMLVPRYSVVVANPPYMGRKNMNAELASFAKARFPETRSDLFSMFVERCLDLLPLGGYAGLMTPYVWMFIATYAPLRERLINREAISSLIQLEYSGFDGATVPICAYVLHRGPSSAQGAYVRLSDFVGAAVQGPMALEIIQDDRQIRQGFASNGLSRHLYRIATTEFVKIPGSPIAYWLSGTMRNAFTGPSMGDIADPKVGMQTANNAKYLRYWWEVDANEVLSPLSKKSKWVRYLKGGDFRRWAGNDDIVLHYNGDPQYVLNQKNATVLPLERGYAPKVSWTSVSSGDFSARLSTEGSFHDIGGHCMYPAESDVEWVLGYANSNVFRDYMKVLAPTLNFQVGDVARVPALNHKKSVIAEHAMGAYIASIVDWNSIETSRGFSLLSSVAPGVFPDSLDRRFRDLSATYIQAARDQQQREVENNRAVSQALGTDDEVPVDVPLHRVSLFRNVEFRYGPGKSPAEYEALERADFVSELISYAVGCMFGRYSLDEPGLILANLGSTVQEYLTRIPSPIFMPDADNVLPIVDGDWFEDDIVARLRQFLRAAFGEQYFEDNLRFVEESLGVKTLREYFITSRGRSKFYDDHVKRYRKRPIYWLFSSPRGSFNALVYMHRYTPSIVSTVLNEYLREFESKLEANLQHQERLAVGDGTPREKAAALKEAERLRKVLVELGEYEHDVLYPLASQQIAIDLDDGVKTNYPKFYPALKKISGVEAADD